MTGCAALQLQGVKMDTELIKQFSAIVRKENAVTDENDLHPYVYENRDLYLGRTPLALKPRTTQEVADILKLANATNTPVVPQGGNTGHAAGAIGHGGDGLCAAELEDLGNAAFFRCDEYSRVCRAVRARGRAENPQRAACNAAGHGQHDRR